MSIFHLQSTDETGWELIRELDNVENWSERTKIISKHDHQFYTDCAKVRPNERCGLLFFTIFHNRNL